MEDTLLTIIIQLTRWNYSNQIRSTVVQSAMGNWNTVSAFHNFDFDRLLKPCKN